MKKKMEQKNKVEVVCWRFAEKLEKGEPASTKSTLSIVKCVAGFVIKENKKTWKFLPPKPLADSSIRLKF